MGRPYESDAFSRPPLLRRAACLSTASPWSMDGPPGFRATSQSIGSSRATVLRSQIGISSRQTLLHGVKTLSQAEKRSGFRRYGPEYSNSAYSAYWPELSHDSPSTLKRSTVDMPSSLRFDVKPVGLSR